MVGGTANPGTVGPTGKAKQPGFHSIGTDVKDIKTHRNSTDVLATACHNIEEGNRYRFHY